MNKKALYETIMNGVSKKLQVTLNENLNHCTDVDWDLYEDILNMSNEIHQPDIDFRGITDEDDAYELIDNAEAEYLGIIAKSLGFDCYDDMFMAVTEQDPDEVKWMIFQSFIDKYVDELSIIEEGGTVDEFIPG